MDLSKKSNKIPKSNQYTIADVKHQSVVFHKQFTTNEQLRGSSKYNFTDNELLEKKDLKYFKYLEQKELERKYGVVDNLGFLNLPPLDLTEKKEHNILHANMCAPTLKSPPQGAHVACSGSLCSTFPSLKHLFNDADNQVEKLRCNFATCPVQIHNSVEMCRSFCPHLLPDFERVTKKSHDYKLNKKKVTAKLHALTNLRQSRSFLAFYSISFPLHTPDSECFRLFNIWLTRCRKNLKLDTYLWITERQKNGTLHFHILTNNYMPIGIANYFMQSALLTSKLSNALYMINVNPERYNGVDVKRVYGQGRGLIKYLCKYVTKNNEVFTRLSWHCSRNVSRLFTSAVYDATDEFIINLFKHNLDCKEFSNIYSISYYYNNTYTHKYLKLLHTVNQSIYDML
jgi:hypothetical protein